MWCCKFVFKSTKKPWTLSEKSLSTPNDQEKDQCIETMDEIDITVCGVCLREEDRGGNRHVQWIKCDNCNIWFYMSCVVETDHDDVFICHFCLLKNNDLLCMHNCIYNNSMYLWLHLIPQKEYQQLSIATPITHLLSSVTSVFCV